ncbi:MAG: lactonase family protein [Ferruginibacter sp.]|nr:lactonase family protein [Chitinophagaceae bacterium]
MRLFFSLFLCSFFQAALGQQHYMIVGTYDSPKSDGIYVYRFNSADGTAKEVSRVKTSNPSFVAVSPDERFVYAVHETAPQDGKGGEIMAFTFNKQNGTLTALNKQLSGGDHPCHVEVDKTGKWVFASNYSSGSLSILPVKEDGSLGTAATIKHTGSGPRRQQKGPHTHGAIISENNRMLFVTELGIDKVMLYTFDAATGKLTPAARPFSQSEPGSGPRQLTFHPNQKFAYVIEELSGTVVGYEYKKGKLQTIQRISSMPVGDTSFASSADIHVSPDGKFLYASNRGDANTIAIYSVNKKNGKLEFISHQSTLGKTPRNFSIDPSGKFLLCENQNSDEIVIFKRDINTGLLTDSGNRISVGKPVCIKWISIK